MATPDTRTALAASAILILLICYASTLHGMFQQWMSDEDMGHGAVVPVVVLWIVWRERKRWRKLTLEPSAWGIPLLALGAAMHLAGTLGVGLFASSVAFLISIAGVVVCFGGFQLLRSWTFPFLLALFMMPKLAIVYNQVTLPMQLAASKLAAGMLTTAGKLLFTGDPAQHLVAFDPANGTILWHAGLTANVSNGPITYLLDGQQYVAVGAGDSLYVFTVEP